MNTDRGWMYNRYRDGSLTSEFLIGVESFVTFASNQHSYMNGEDIKCPCKTCKNRLFHPPEVVTSHLVKKGFVPRNYHWWVHGEQESNEAIESNVAIESNLRGEIRANPFETMVFDVGSSRLDNDEQVDEEPNSEARQLYSMLSAANKELWPGCTDHSQLSLVARLMSLKSENHLSEKCFDQLIELIQEIVPKEHSVPKDFYSTKKLLHGMGLPVEQIHCCRNHCMLFWENDKHLTECKFCGASRYKESSGVESSRRKNQVPYSKMYYFPITPRLQRLYASRATAAEMRWHASTCDDGVMRHPADSLAWKHFNQKHPDFALEIRNVRLGLSTDGFQPFGQSGKQYSSWPIIITPYNLPPWMCMKEQHMFLTVIVPGPQNPKERIDVYLQPLIAELIHLWDVGVDTYDVSLKQNFRMRAALLWTVSDFPAYSMLSGWSTAGRLACPHCMTRSDAFSLPKSGKQSWFDNHRKFLRADHPWRRDKKHFIKNKVVHELYPEMMTGAEILHEIHSLGLKKVTELDVEATQHRVSKRQKRSDCGWRKKSIFWDLPYWSSLLIRHNLDVMHIEKNVFDNIFNTVMNIKGKTKDTDKSREELNLLCNRPELKRDEVTGLYPKASYVLDVEEKKIFCKWIEQLKFPDGYASNLGRCVNMRTLQMFGMKSHDCHVMLQRILPIGFRELLPTPVWNAITSMGLFFKELTSPNIKLEDMCRLHDNIPIILCSLERIFPPSFFDSMEHLPIHLAEEARIAGPVQYRWMYPFERYLGKLKKTVRNKARVEGSIANAYLVEEASNFCSYYFEDHVRTKHRNVPRNYMGQVDDSHIPDDPQKLTIFKYAGRPMGKKSQRNLDMREYDAAHLYVLNNCVEVVDVYFPIFVNQLKIMHPNISDDEIQRRLLNDFPNWFKHYAMDQNNEIDNLYILELAKGPFQRVFTYTGFYTNGFNFNTMSHGSSRVTNNSGVCVKASNYSSEEQDFYGQLLEVVELEYPGFPLKKVVLFKCDWFDPSPMGTSVHPNFNLISVNHRRRYPRYEPFVLAKQASQVYFCSYPSKRVNKRDWWEVCKIRPRSIVELPVPSTNLEPFQDSEVDGIHIPIIGENEVVRHPDGGFMQMEDEDGNEDDEPEFDTEPPSDYE